MLPEAARLRGSGSAGATTSADGPDDDDDLDSDTLGATTPPSGISAVISICCSDGSEMYSGFHRLISLAALVTSASLARLVH